MIECEPVICDPFCGSGCLSRAVRVIAFRFSLVCLTVCDDGVLLGACAVLRSECRNASIPSCKYAVYVTRVIGAGCVAIWPVTVLAPGYSR